MLKLVENMRDNLWGPMVIAQICKENDIHFTYMGTGCIFHYSNEAYPLEDGSVEKYAIPSLAAGLSCCTSQRVSKAQET